MRTDLAPLLCSRVPAVVVLHVARVPSYVHLGRLAAEPHASLFVFCN